MTANKAITYKKPNMALQWLETALNKEKEKYRKCPIKPDMAPDFETAQEWGYVVTGYFLLEQSFKLLLHTRQKSMCQTHSLYDLFSRLSQNDKEILREYYTDYRETIGGSAGKFPITDLDEFLSNLDGSGKKGSFDWRYSPIEKPRSDNLPTVRIEFLHEIVYGTICIIEYALYSNFSPLSRTHSLRLRRTRKEFYARWLSSRMGSDEWDELGDRLEILWGPDYRGRHDLLEFKDGKIQGSFQPLPENYPLRIIDKIVEVNAYFRHLEEKSQT